MRIGDRVTVDGYPATVVAMLAEGSFANDYSPADWAYLRKDLLVVSDEGGLIHYGELSDHCIELLESDSSGLNRLGIFNEALI